ncbi:DUF4270 family protein [Chishuiella sp.]|uniref:DUF4270 family protein n=1 Tax=Chishuiella sp. TaxID=1969467 RepID=UPI0028AABACE|nr:DUF4270 family protein [Chishuiella sp.]
MKKYLNILFIALAIGVGMVSCQDETVNTGNGVVGNDASGNVKELDVIAYNAKFDTLRTDNFVLQNGALGIYNDAIFGTTSSKFYTQFRPSTSSLSVVDFGTNSTVDSVNLFLPVYYDSSSDPISKDTLNLSNKGVAPTDNDTILITTKYAVDSIYGNKDVSMTLNIRDIDTPLYSSSKYFSKLDGSESPFTINSKIIGTAKIGTTVSNKIIKVKSSSSNIYQETVGYKISLDKDYFNEKIIQNASKGLTSDYATFIRQNIKGFEFSVEDTNGFILNFNPNNIDLKMYYSYKNPTAKTDGQTNYQERLSTSYTFDFSNIWSSTSTDTKSNVLASQIVNNYTGSAYQTALSNANSTTGDARLFLNGMSGSYVNLKINQEQLTAFKTLMSSSNITIVGAKLKFYIDETYGLAKPPYITAWNNYTKDGATVNALYADITDFYNAYPSSVHFNPIVQGSTNYYTIDITKHLKSMLEKENVFENQSMIVTMGNFIMSVSDATTINSANPYQNNRAYNPYRMVLHGNNSEVDAKKLKLLVYYSLRS